MHKTRKVNIYQEQAAGFNIHDLHCCLYVSLLLVQDFILFSPDFSFLISSHLSCSPFSMVQMCRSICIVLNSFDTLNTIVTQPNYNH